MISTFSVLLLVSIGALVAAQPEQLNLKVEAPQAYNGQHFKHRGHHDHDDDDDDDRDDSECGECREFRATCQGYNGPQMCTRPTIRRATNKQGCLVIISCDRGELYSAATLETVDGEVLSKGFGVNGVASCHKKRWTGRDWTGERISFRKVRCLENFPTGGAYPPTGPTGPYPPAPPAYPPSGPYQPSEPEYGSAGGY